MPDAERDALFAALRDERATLGGVARALGVSHPEAQERYEAWLTDAPVPVTFCDCVPPSGRPVLHPVDGSQCVPRPGGSDV